MQSAELLKDILCSFYDETEQYKEEVPKEICELLRYPLCKMMLRIFPEAMTKMHEVITAEEEKLDISLKLHGHDLQKGESNFEEKTSIVKKTSPSKCNFMWNIPTAKDQRTALLDSVNEKTKDGCAIFTITDTMNRKVCQYRLSNKFLVGYFSRLDPLPKSKHNFGSSFCWKCKCCPRLEKFQAFNDKYENIDPPESEWNNMFKKVIHQCLK